MKMFRLNFRQIKFGFKQTIFCRLITHVITWGNKNGLKFSNEKFELLHLENETLLHGHPRRCYTVNDVGIKPAGITRNLRLLMTSDLKQNEHIKNKFPVVLNNEVQIDDRKIRKQVHHSMPEIEANVRMYNLPNLTSAETPFLLEYPRFT